jgi:hypothetical protein
MISLTTNDMGTLSALFTKACGSIERQSEEIGRLNQIIAEQAEQIKRLEERLVLVEDEPQPEGD